MKTTRTTTALKALIVLVFFLSCHKELECYDCETNTPPVARAGIDQKITLPTDSVLLDGNLSSDADGKINEWLWTKIEGPASFSIVNSNAAITAVKNLTAGIYSFELKVTDDKRASSKDTVQIVVDGQGNQAPVACAGTDQTITLPANSVTLDGSCSTDPDYNISSYGWTKISGPAANISTANGVKTLVTGLVQGTYQFELKVTDAGALFDRDTVQVTVNPDLSFAIQWQKAIGGSRVDVAQSIQPTADGGYIVVGNTNSPDGDITGYHPGQTGCYQDCWGKTFCGDYFPDGLVVKLSSSGAIQWQKALGGSSAENLLSIQATADGGYIASGLTYSNDGDVSGFHGGNEPDAWVVKLSSNGDIQWQKVLGGSTGCDFANAVLSTPDGGYMIVGHTDSKDGDVTFIAGERDVWLVKLSSSGAIQWQKTIGGAKSDYAYSLQSTPDGGYIAAGYTYSNDGDVSGNHGDADAWVVKLSSSGAIQWQKALGGSNEEIARSIQLTADGGYILAASAKSNDGDVSGNHGDADAWIVKLSSNGAIQWQKALGGFNEEIARSVQRTSDGGYIVAGSAKSNDGDVGGNHGGQDAWIVKLSNNGSLQWQKPMGGTANDFVNSVQRTTDGGYIVAGQALSNSGDVSGNHGSTDAWVIKLKR